MVTAVAAFYIVLSLGAQDVIRFLSSLESDAVERLLTNLLPTVYVCALLFVFFLVVFANKYQLECRSRELGLYLMFGMTKTRLFTQIMTEGLITSLVALLGGLICGGFLSEVISLATARLVGHGVIAHQSSFSLSAVFFTILGFLIIQCVALFILCGKLFKKEVHQLLYGEMGKKQHTGSTHGSLLSLVIGTAVLLVAYWVVIEHFMTGGGVMLLVAVLLGIVGTILFIRGIARLLSIVAASNKRKATNGLYVFTLRQLHENVVYKYISISVASILMMLTIMFIANGSATIMSHGNELTRTSAVYDFTVMGEEQNVEQYLSDDQMRVYVANLNRMETGNMKRPASGEMKSFVDWSVLRKEIVQNLPEGVIDPATQEAASYEFGSHQPAALNLLGFIDTGSVSPYMLPVSSYNRLLEAAGEKQINLENDEAVFYLNPDFLEDEQEDTVGEKLILLLDERQRKELAQYSPYIAIPKVSSQNRRYIPMDYLEGEIIPGDKLFTMPSATSYEFGILMSNVHMAWTRAVCGRLKSDYSYSNMIVYNNFPWPSPTNDQKEKIRKTAQAILNARALYTDSNLADLYDPLTMPTELLKAHKANNRAVMHAYGFSIKMSEADCVAELMRMYQKLTKEK